MEIHSLDIDRMLVAAIQHKRVVRLQYLGKERVVEPHDYGIQSGRPRLLAYQIGGASSGKLPGWRWIDVDQISGLELLDRNFPGGRPAPSGRHHRWEELFIRVGAAE